MANFMKKTFTFGFVFTTWLTSDQVFWGTTEGEVDKWCQLWVGSTENKSSTESRSLSSHLGKKGGIHSYQMTGCT